MRLGPGLVVLLPDLRAGALRGLGDASGAAAQRRPGLDHHPALLVLLNPVSKSARSADMGGGWGWLLGMKELDLVFFVVVLFELDLSSPWF